MFQHNKYLIHNRLFVYQDAKKKYLTSNLNWNLNTLPVQYSNFSWTSFKVLNFSRPILVLTSYLIFLLEINTPQSYHFFTLSRLVIYLNRNANFTAVAHTTDENCCVNFLYFCDSESKFSSALARSFIFFFCWLEWLCVLHLNAQHDTIWVPTEYNAAFHWKVSWRCSSLHLPSKARQQQNVNISTF